MYILGVYWLQELAFLRLIIYIAKAMPVCDQNHDVGRKKHFLYGVIAAYQEEPRTLMLWLILLASLQ